MMDIDTKIDLINASNAISEEEDREMFISNIMNQNRLKEQKKNREIISICLIITFVSITLMIGTILQNI